MDIQQLKYFITTAEYEHLSHAAETLNISQSSLSYSINQLENELGVSLFDRIGRNIKLNKAGLTFKQYAIEIVQLAGEAKDTINAQYGEASRTIVFQTTPLSFFDSLFDQLYAIDENIEVVPIAADTPSVLADNLLHCKTDLCFSPFELPDAGLDWEELNGSEILALVSSEHPLANKTSISMDVLAKQQFITGATPIASYYLDQLAKQEHFTPEIKAKSATHEEAFYLLKKMPAVYLVNDNVIERIKSTFDFSDLHILALETPHNVFRRRLYWRKKNNPPAVKALKDVFISYFDHS